VGRGSNKFGWLQHFLNCIKTLMTDRRFPLAKISFVLALDIKSSYKYLCLLLSGHLTRCSYFFGNCFSTSLFNLRRMKGLNTLWSLLTNSLLYSMLPSTMPVMGLLNHSLKSRWDSNTWGIRKCIRDQSSIKLFWRGVPVSNNLPTLVKLSNSCHRWDLKFLMCWASSRMKYCHLNLLNELWSWITNL